MKKQLLLFSLVLIFLIVSVQAITFKPTSLTINTKCGGAGWESISLTEVPANCTVKLSEKLPRTGGLDGLYLGFYSTSLLEGGTPKSPSKLHILYAVDKTTCEEGQENITLDVCGTDYNIIVNVAEDLSPLNDGNIYYLKKGKRFSIGNSIHFNLLGVGSDSVNYLLEGCDNEDQILDKDETLETTCGNERLRIKIEDLIPDFELAGFLIEFSNPSYILTQSEANTTLSGETPECILGIDTLGAVVRRGSVLAFNTINTVTGKYEGGVVVNVLDQAGELPPISGQSDNTGFFSKRIPEDYKQDLIIKLFKEGCEPTNKVVLFEQSYDDYKKGKEEELGRHKLILNISGKFEINKELSFTVKNALDEAVEGVKVKITRPDNSNFEVTTDSNGVFKFTPDKAGIWKIQAGKDDYESSKLNEIEIYQNKEYLVVIKSIDGEPKSEYKKGDKLRFELRDMNNTLIPLNIDATFAGQPLKFINGVSDIVTFEGTSTLSIPATEGYIQQQIELTESKTNLSGILWVIGIIIGFLIIVIIIVAIIKKFKGESIGNLSKIPKALEGADIKLD